MSSRLIFAIVSTLLEEVAFAVIGLWWLPKIGMQIPMAVFIVFMVAWGAWGVITYQLGSQALRRKQLVGLLDMVGSEGKVVTCLAPEGLVMIRGELWVAKSATGGMAPGEEVTVVKQDSLKLVVRPK